MNQAFNDVVRLLNADHHNYARMLQLILLNLGSKELNSFPDRGEWEGPLDQLMGSDSSLLDDRTWLAFNQDFLRILETTGRPDVATRYLVDKIGIIDRAGLDAWRELQMFHWLVPFVSDLCKTISFEMSAASSWQLRQTPGYNRYLDFLHNIAPDGDLVVPGQVVLVLDEPGPYGATSPEEDCATTLAVYGVVGSDLYGLAERTPPGDVRKVVVGIEDWVRDSKDRTDSSLSLVPYLKLIWVEWFSQAFGSLMSPDFTIDTFSYSPLTASEMTERRTVESLSNHHALQDHNRALLELFLETRDFLEERYP